MTTTGRSLQDSEASKRRNNEFYFKRRIYIMIDTTDEITDFLASVERLRDDEGAIRTTAHTSSIIASGWPSVAR
jgi:hypothetical protein